MASIPKKFKTVPQDLRTRILSAPEFVYCAMFNNQVKQEEAGKTFDFPKPAVLMELQSPTPGIQGLGGYITVNDFVWRFYIVHEQLNAEHTGEPGTGMDENLDVFDLRDTLKTILTGFKPTNCSPLQYVEESMDYAHGNIYVYGISFKCSYVDTKGSPFDPESEVWVEGTLTQLNLNTFLGWQSTKPYIFGENAVVYDEKIYICIQDNEDSEFNPDNWLEIAPWIPLGPYVDGDPVAFEGHIYVCTADNTDAEFTIANWQIFL